MFEIEAFEIKYTSPSNKMSIKDLIISILEGREVRIVDVVQPMEQRSQNESLYEIPTTDLLNYTIPYIKGVVSDRSDAKERALELFGEYCEDCEYLNLVDKDVVRICKESIRLFNRDSRIALAKRLNNLRFDYVDWEDREWIIGLVEHFYIKAMRSIEYLKKEMALAQGKNRDRAVESNGIECIRIDTKGRRENILISRIEPTVTLEEFADKLMANMSETKINASSLEEESSSEKYSREELMKKDEENDSKNINRGNTLGMG